MYDGDKVLQAMMEKVSDAYLHPAPGDEDVNRHTRLAVLASQFKMSTVKIRKLLITAGVYEHVYKKDPSVVIKKLNGEGKNIEEIAEQTGLSQSSVYSYLPYTTSVYRADKHEDILDGLETASFDAKRKRLERKEADMKKQEVVAALGQQVSDDAFWNALKEHSGESFYSTKQEKFTIEVRDDLAVDDKRFTRDEVLAVLHNALEKVNPLGISEDMLDQTDALPYVYSLLVVFGVIDGDARLYQVRRNFITHIICSCCGRRSDRLFTVCSYADLKQIQETLNQERLDAMSEEERERNDRAEAAYKAHYELTHGESLEEDIKRREQKALSSKAVAEFDEHKEELHLCQFCAETIRMALDDGDAPTVQNRVDYRALPLSMLEEEFEKTLVEVSSAIDKAGRKYGEEEMFFATHDHLFVLSYREQGDMIFLYATEVHKLTKAGKVAAGASKTDYEVEHGLRVTSLGGKEKLVGLLELEDKINDVLMNPTMDRHGMRNVGTIIPAYFGDERGEYGFIVDGREYSGGELARKFSRVEGWHIHYQVDDRFSDVLTHGEYLMPVRLGKKELVNETIELLNMFSENGEFIGDHDRENFEKLFERVLEKLKLYYESNPRGYGRLAGIEVIRRLAWVEDTESEVDKVREIIGG